MREGMNMASFALDCLLFGYLFRSLDEVEVKNLSCRSDMCPLHGQNRVATSSAFIDTDICVAGIQFFNPVSNNGTTRPLFSFNVKVVVKTNKESRWCLQHETCNSRFDGSVRLNTRDANPCSTRLVSETSVDVSGAVPDYTH